MTYRERREARAERLRGWAAGRRQKAAARFNAAHDRAEQIPLGQPILVGHHSERRHRRALERIDRAITRGHEHQQKAASMENRAAGIEHQADRAIYRDDPDAIDALEERIAGLELQRERRKTINQQIRKGPGWEARIAPPLTDEERADLTSAARFSQCIGYPPYALQNLSGNIARQRARLTALQRQRHDPHCTCPDCIIDHARQIGQPIEEPPCPE